VARLTEITRAEGIEISETSLLALAREGQGSMRDSQTLLDQIIASTGSPIDDEMVRSLLSLTDRRVLLAILEAAIDSDAAAALEACNTAMQSGSEVKLLSGALIRLLRDLVVLTVAPDVDGLVEGGEAEIEALREIAKRAEPTRLRRMFAALVKEQATIDFSPEPAAVLEMALVRIATMPSGEQVSELLSRLDSLEKTLAGGVPTPGAGNGRGGSSGGSGGGSGGGTRSSSAGAGGRPNPKPAASSAPKSGRTAAATPAEATAPSAPLPVVLDRLRGFVRERDRGLSTSLDAAELVTRRPGHLKLAPKTAFHYRRLNDRLDEVNHICSDFFGQETKVELVTPAEGVDTPAKDGPNPGREQARRQRHEALNHPSVNLALELLDAEIVEILPQGGK